MISYPVFPSFYLFRVALLIRVVRAIYTSAFSVSFFHYLFNPFPAKGTSGDGPIAIIRWLLFPLDINVTS